MEMLADRTSPACVSISATLLFLVAPEAPARACPEVEVELERRERVDSEEQVRERVSIVAVPGGKDGND